MTKKKSRFLVVEALIMWILITMWRVCLFSALVISAFIYLIKKIGKHYGL